MTDPTTEARKVIGGYWCNGNKRPCDDICAHCAEHANGAIAALDRAGKVIVDKARSIDPPDPNGITVEEFHDFLDDMTKDIAPPPGVLSEAEIAEFEQTLRFQEIERWAGRPTISVAFENDADVRDVLPALLRSHRALSVANTTLVRERDEARRALELAITAYHSDLGNFSDIWPERYKVARAALPSPSESK